MTKKDIIESEAYWNGYNAGIEDTIDKACEWMRTKMNRYTHTSPYGICVMMDKAEAAFRKAMEE